jgi:hypothetical protein
MRKEPIFGWILVRSSRAISGRDRACSAPRGDSYRLDQSSATAMHWPSPPTSSGTPRQETMINPKVGTSCEVSPRPDETASSATQVGAYVHAIFDLGQTEISGSISTLHRSHEARCQGHKSARGLQPQKIVDPARPVRFRDQIHRLRLSADPLARYSVHRSLLLRTKHLNGSKFA